MRIPLHIFLDNVFNVNTFFHLLSIQSLFTLSICPCPIWTTSKSIPMSNLSISMVGWNSVYIQEQHYAVLRPTPANALKLFTLFLMALPRPNLIVNFHKFRNTFLAVLYRPTVFNLLASIFRTHTSISCLRSYYYLIPKFSSFVHNFTVFYLSAFIVLTNRWLTPESWKLFAQ